jgi:hypothetical protein
MGNRCNQLPQPAYFSQLQHPLEKQGKWNELPPVLLTLKNIHPK